MELEPALGSLMSVENGGTDKVQGWNPNGVRHARTSQEVTFSWKPVSLSPIFFLLYPLFGCSSQCEEMVGTDDICSHSTE
jgi:hypothetical protein